MESEKLLKAQDVAEMLGNCHIQTVYKMASAGVLPSLKLGTWRRFRAKDIAAFVAARAGVKDAE